MVERQVNIKVNHEGVDEARSSVEELNSALDDTKTTVVELRGEVETLAAAIDKMNDNASKVRKSIQEVTTTSTKKKTRKKSASASTSKQIDDDEPDEVPRSRILGPREYHSSPSFDDIRTYYGQKNVNTRGYEQFVIANEKRGQPDPYGKYGPYQYAHATSGLAVGGVSFRQSMDREIIEISNLGASVFGKGLGVALIETIKKHAIEDPSAKLLIARNAVPDAHPTWMRSGFKFADPTDKGVFVGDMFMDLAKERRNRLPTLSAPNIRAPIDELRELSDKTRRSGKEELLFYDTVLKQRVTPSYKSGADRVSITDEKRMRELLQTPHKLSDFHTHPDEKVVVPSPTDLLRMLIPGLEGGVISAKTGDAMALEAPEKFGDPKARKGLMDEWAKIIDNINDELVSSYGLRSLRPDFKDTRYTEYRKRFEDLMSGHGVKVKSFNVYDKYNPGTPGSPANTELSDDDIIKMMTESRRTFKDPERIREFLTKMAVEHKGTLTQAKLEDLVTEHTQWRGKTGDLMTTWSRILKATPWIKRTSKPTELATPIMEIMEKTPDIGLEDLNKILQKDFNYTDKNIGLGSLNKYISGTKFKKQFASFLESREHERDKRDYQIEKERDEKLSSILDTAGAQIIRFRVPQVQFKTGQEHADFLEELGRRIDTSRFAIHSTDPYPVNPEDLSGRGPMTAGIEVSVKSSLKKVSEIEKFLDEAYENARAVTKLFPDITSRAKTLVGRVGTYVKTPLTPEEQERVEKQHAERIKRQNEIRIAKWEAFKKDVERGMREYERPWTTARKAIGRHFGEVKRTEYETGTGLIEEHKPAGRVIDANELLRRVAFERMPASEDEGADEAAKLRMRELIGAHFKYQDRGPTETYKRGEGGIIDANEIVRRVGTRRMPPVKEVAAETKTAGIDIGKVIDGLANKGGVLGKLSWTFTSLAMSALGVYFSLMSVVNMLSQGIMSVFNPLQNLQGVMQAFGMGQMKLKGGAADLNAYLEKLGMSIGDVAEGSLRFQSLMQGFQFTMAAFGAKLMLDPDVWQDLQEILGEVQGFLTRPETFSLVKGIIAALRDSLPDILEAFMFIGEVIRAALPYAGLFAKAWAAALVIMPVASFASAILNIGKAVVTLTGLFIGLKNSIVAASAAQNLGALGTLGMLGKGAAVGVAGVGVAHNLGVLSYARESAWNLGHDEDIRPYQHQPIPWWDIIGGITGKPTFRAAGGPLRAGQMAVVGERGPEIIIPKGDVDVVPNHKVRFLAEGTQNSMGMGMSMFRVQEANNLVQKNTVAVTESTRATQELTDMIGRYRVEGTSILGAAGDSPAGGVSARHLGEVAPWTMSQNGKTWTMDTSVGLGEGIMRSNPRAVFGGLPEGTPGEPVAAGGESGLDLNSLMLAGMVGLPLLKKYSGKLGGLKGIGGKLAGMLGRGGKAATAAEPLMMEIGEMLGGAGSGAQTFEVLGAPATMTPAGSTIASMGTGAFLGSAAAGVGLGAAGIVGLDQLGIMSGIRKAGYGLSHGGSQVGYTEQEHEWYDIPAAITGQRSFMSDMFAPKNPMANVTSDPEQKSQMDRLNQGLFDAKDVLEAFKKESGDNQDTANKYLGSINANTLVPAKILGQTGSGSGAGTAAGPGTAAAAIKPPGGAAAAAGAPLLGPADVLGHQDKMIGMGPGGWAEGLTGNATIDFAPGGEGWHRNYTPGQMYGPGGKSGAPSVGYNQIDPYYKPGTVGNDDWTQVVYQWYYTDAKGVTHKVSGKNQYPEGAYTPVGAGKVAGTGEKTKSQIRMEAEASKSHGQAEKWSNASRSDFGFTEQAGATAGQVGEIVQQGKETFIRQADGSRKLISSAASGGLLKASGLINAHAGEVIGPLGQVASTIASAAVNSNNTQSSNQDITINITINGNADKAVTDDMVRKIKRELFGRGVST